MTQARYATHTPAAVAASSHGRGLLRSEIMARMIGVVLLVVLMTTGAAMASTHDAEIRDLRERFRQRFPQIQQAQREQQLGETWQGLIAVVKPPASSELQALVEQENRDRARLYELIASEDEAATTALVAHQNALRNLENRGDQRLLFHDPLDQWRPREQWVRYLLTERAKPLAQLGETAEGLIAIVPDELRPQAISDEQRNRLTRLVEAENQYRNRIYQRIATAEDRPVTSVAREAGVRHLNHALPGQVVRSADGTWRQLPLSGR